MKIGHPAAPPVATNAATTERAAPTDNSAPIRVTVPTGATGTVEPSTQVTVSSTASTLRSGATAASSDFDADKVARISAAIDNGTFKVNHEAIADKLISNAQEVLSKVSSR